MKREQLVRALAAQVSGRISEYLQAGGLFHPELMDHDKVRELLIDSRDALDKCCCELSKETP